MKSDASDVPTAVLLELVKEWRRDTSRSLTCPCCEATGLEIADRSARPYREWYALSCKPCGFARTVAVSLAASIPGT